MISACQPVFRFDSRRKQTPLGSPRSDASCVTVAAEITQPQQVAQPDEGRPMAWSDWDVMGWMITIGVLLHSYIYIYILCIYIYTLILYIYFLILYINMLNIYMLYIYISAYMRLHCMCIYVYISLYYVYIYIYCLYYLYVYKYTVTVYIYTHIPGPIHKPFKQVLPKSSQVPNSCHYPVNEV